MILVTGGLGFIGSNFVMMALEDKLPGISEDEITILDNETYAGSVSNLGACALNQKLQIVKGDVRDLKLVSDLVQSSNRVVHFAAESHVDRSIYEPDVFIQTNILGTTNLVKSADKWGKRLLIVSTDEVYGSLQEGEADEKAVLNPSSPYSASKAAADLVGLSYHKTFGTDIVITRSANNYGRNQHSEKFIPTVIRSITQNQLIPVYGNGRNVRNWIHVEDHCLGIALALQVANAGDVYNFSTSEYLQNIEICQILLNHRKQSNSRVNFIEDRKGHDFRYGVDSQKARSVLGWKPTHNFADTLDELFESYSH